MLEPLDLVVVGSGAAGLSAALRAAELGARVAVLTAGALLAGSSPRAQGGVAAAVGADDTPALHANDTLHVGGGLNDARAVDVLTGEATHSLEPLRDVFADDLGLEAGHARRRILHAGGGATGQVLTSALLARALDNSRITLVDHSPVTALALSDGRVTGVVARRKFEARAVMLATGGYAALWGRSTNAPETRGSGLGLAYQAGATLADLEFVQFHPTALAIPNQPALLLSEALRGEGARLMDERDREIANPLLPRDVLARALHAHLTAGHQAFLSLRHLDPNTVYAHFSALAQAVLDASGLDLARDYLPVAPAAHYCMGGIRADTWGRTDVAGLYAAGEVACSGAQGANRLASNSLLECLVFGSRTAEAALGDPPDASATWHTTSLPADLVRSSPTNVIAAIGAGALGKCLDRDVGVQRGAPRLTRLAAELPEPDNAPTSDLLLASLICRSALLRQESRGAHYRADYPRSDDTAWRGRIHWRRGQPPVFEEVSS
jgi:L-aspartate oxidase